MKVWARWIQGLITKFMKSFTTHRMLKKEKKYVAWKVLWSSKYSHCLTLKSAASAGAI